MSFMLAYIRIQDLLNVNHARYACDGRYRMYRPTYIRVSLKRVCGRVGSIPVSCSGVLSSDLGYSGWDLQPRIEVDAVPKNLGYGRFFEHPHISVNAVTYYD
jgi:hypothetical protein